MSRLAEKEERSINEVESVCELIAGSLFDKEIPDSDDDGMDTSSPTFELYFFERTGHQIEPFTAPAEYFSFNYKRFPSLHKEPHSPPPKLA